MNERRRWWVPVSVSVSVGADAREAEEYEYEYRTPRFVIRWVLTAGDAGGLVVVPYEFGVWCCAVRDSDSEE